MRRVTNSNSGICRDDVLDILRDREWHPLTEIVQRLSDKINPEEATRQFVFPRGKGKASERDMEAAEKRKQLPDDVRVAGGKKLIVSTIIHGDHRIETQSIVDPATFDRQMLVRFSGWYCWSCGDSQNGSGNAERRLCGKCVELVPE